MLIKTVLVAEIHAAGSQCCNLTQSSHLCQAVVSAALGHVRALFSVLLLGLRGCIFHGWLLVHIYDWR